VWEARFLLKLVQRGVRCTPDWGHRESVLGLILPCCTGHIRCNTGPNTGREKVTVGGLFLAVGVLAVPPGAAVGPPRTAVAVAKAVRGRKKRGKR
jgi:hypothetical protein